MPPVLRGERVLLRAPVEEDAAPLADMFAQGAVSIWWGYWDIERVRSDVIARDDGTVVFTVVVDNLAVGIVQYGEETDPMYMSANIDIALHTDWHGQGLGSDAVRTVARYLFDERGHHRITIDPAVSNTSAIRSYQRVGFRPVGVMRQYEQGPDGSWHDGLLMDLLRNDLR